jgi:hypothetical protein
MTAAKENPMRIPGIACCVTMLFAAGPHSGSAQEKTDPEVRIVKYDGLVQEVLKHRGKVVLVDIWFLT